MFHPRPSALGPNPVLGKLGTNETGDTVKIKALEVPPPGMGFCTVRA